MPKFGNLLFTKGLILNLFSKNPTKLVSYYLKNICKNVLNNRVHKVLCL